MNKYIKKIAEQFEEEFNDIFNILLLPDGKVIYNKYVITNINNKWNLYRKQNKVLLHKFNLKVSAIIAAKMNEIDNLLVYEDIIMFDRLYYYNFNNCEMYEKLLKVCNDVEKYEIIQHKLSDSIYKMEKYKSDIIKLFKRYFFINNNNRVLGIRHANKRFKQNYN